MIYNNLFHVQEGLFVPEDIEERFCLSRKDINSKGNCEFTGLVIKNKDVLIAWPKHFHKEKDVTNATREQAQLLFAILMKYMKQIEESCFLNDISIDIEDMFPIVSFKNILDYYRNYGLYKEESIIRKQGYVGKIDWKSTMAQSNKVISNNQLLFIPFHIKEKHTENVFLSECMAYVINETYSMLSFLFPNRPHLDLNYNKDLFLDNEYVLTRLYSLKGRIFKDINKRLLKDLINYFKVVGNTKYLKYKNYHFNLIWEAMIGDYLNRNVKEITKSTIQFKNNCNIFNFNKKSFDIAGWGIEIDHYYEDDNYIYVLDSKYYQSLDSLDYKQVAYDYFLRSEEKELINALIVSSDENKSETHIDYSKHDLTIMSHFLSVQKVMRDCANQ